MTNDDEHRIAALLAHGITSAAKISAILASEKRQGVSTSSVKRFLRSLRGAPASAPNNSAPAATPAPEKSEKPENIQETNPLADLEKIRDDALDATDRANAELSIFCARYPNVARALEKGSTKFEALFCNGHLRGVNALSSAQDIADVIEHITDSPFMIEREPDWTEEKYKAACVEAGKEEHALATKLLRDALTIISERGIAKHWLR